MCISVFQYKYKTETTTTHKIILLRSKQPFTRKL